MANDGPWSATPGVRIDRGPGVRVVRMTEHNGVLNTIVHVVPSRTRRSG